MEYLLVHTHVSFTNSGRSDPLINTTTVLIITTRVCEVTNNQYLLTSYDFVLVLYFSK